MQELSIPNLQAQMRAGETTAQRLVEQYLERIDAFDTHGPKVNSVIELNPDAAVIAHALDKERQAGKLRGPLHGIPVLLKDNIDTHDRMQTTAGSLALEGHIALRDAFLVERLRAAGAVILGKTNLSEWANFRGKKSVSGWSSRGGLTRNPYALDRSACGSSSGSGAAVAANFCAAAIGTETDGSIICPSQTNGIVGIKPTLGLISRSGIIPISHSQDTAGPMARTVTDAAILLGVMTGVDDRDRATRASARHALADYTRFLDKDGLRGARLGVVRNLAGGHPRIQQVFEANLDVLRQLGAGLIDPANLANLEQAGDHEGEVLHFEFKADLNRYLAAAGPSARVRSLADVIAFNEANAARVMPYFGQERMVEAQARGSLRSPKYRDALSAGRRMMRKDGIDAVMKQHRLDALVAPSGGPAWLIDLVNGDSYNWDVGTTSPAAQAGYPHITVPAGYVSGLPVGLSFFAKAWQEPKLIRLAYAFEQATLVHRPPQFLKKASDKPRAKKTSLTP
jgi:amidase